MSELVLTLSQLGHTPTNINTTLIPQERRELDQTRISTSVGDLVVILNKAAEIAVEPNVKGMYINYEDINETPSKPMYDMILEYITPKVIKILSALTFLTFIVMTITMRNYIFVIPEFFLGILGTSVFLYWVKDVEPFKKIK